MQVRQTLLLMTGSARRVACILPTRNSRIAALRLHRRRSLRPHRSGQPSHQAQEQHQRHSRHFKALLRRSIRSPSLHSNVACRAEQAPIHATAKLTLSLPAALRKVIRLSRQGRTTSQQIKPAQTCTSLSASRCVPFKHAHRRPFAVLIDKSSHRTRRPFGINAKHAAP